MHGGHWLRTRIALWARLFFVAALLSPTTLLAQEAALSGEVLRLTPQRTGVLLDLAGDATLEAGQSVKLSVDGKKRTGTVKKITENGNAFIRTTKALPKAVEVGDTISLTAVESGAAKPAGVKIAGGGYNKAYWDDVSFLATHRKAGPRADVEVGFLSGAGADKSSGGSFEDDTEYAVADKTTSFGGGGGWVGRGGFGGGVLLDYLKTDRVASADIETESTATVDDDEVKNTRTVTDVMPYLAFLSRAKTGDVGFGVGLGVPIRTTVAKNSVKIAGETTDIDPAKTTETGVSIEALVGNNSWAVILVTTPVLGGKVKQSGQDDVDHKSSEYGLNLELYGSLLKKRLGLTMLNSSDDYEDDKLTESGMRGSVRVDWTVGPVNLVPYLDYTRLARKRGDAKGTTSETEFGARVAKSGIYAPFVALGVSLRSSKESSGEDRDIETSTGGAKLAAGLSI